MENHPSRACRARHHQRGQAWRRCDHWV